MGYPGKGIRYVRADSKVMLFINNKSRASYMRKGNPRKCAWTAVYRRIHHKGQAADANKKKKARRAGKKVETRGIVGASAALLKKRAAKAKSDKSKQTAVKGVKSGGAKNPVTKPKRDAKKVKAATK